MGEFFSRWFGQRRGEDEEPVVRQNAPQQAVDVNYEGPPAQGADVRVGGDAPVDPHPPDPPQQEPPQNDPAQVPVLPVLNMPQPVGTFQYVPHDYNKPCFVPSGIREADQIANGVSDLFLGRVVDPRKQIDTWLRSFKEKTGHSQEAVLTTCFESWKNMAFSDQLPLPDGKEAFEVLLDKDHKQRVRKIYTNDNRNYLSDEVNAIDDQMNELLEACREFVFDVYNIRNELEEKNKEFSRLPNRSMKTEAMKKEIESLFPELDDHERQVDGLLADIKAAVSSKRMTISRLHTGQIAKPIDSN